MERQEQIDHAKGVAAMIHVNLMRLGPKPPDQRAAGRPPSVPVLVALG
jgi:hypothetical protein